MKNNKLILAALLVVVLGGLSYSGVRSYASRNNNQSVQQLTDDKGNVIQQIALAGDKATPDTVTVPVGHSVQFNTGDGLKHRMGFGIGGHEHQEDNLYESGEFGPGESWRVAFNKPGTYKLHDHHYPNISVLVVAYEPEK